MNRPEWNMRSAHQLFRLNICVNLFHIILSHSWDTEQPRITDRICLTLNCDLDLELTWVEHVLCTSCCTSVPIHFKISSVVQEIQSIQESMTDSQTTMVKTIWLHIIMIKSLHSPIALFYIYLKPSPDNKLLPLNHLSLDSNPRLVRLDKLHSLVPQWA